MEKRIPRRRFKEFVGSGEWEEKKLGEVVDIYDGTHQTPNYTEEGIMFLSVENIKTLTSKKYISKQDFKKDFKVYPEKGDILMTRIGDVGTANVVKSSRPVAYYVSLALLKNNKLDSYFLKECIATKPVQMELWVRTLHIAFPKKINKNEIGNVSLPIPSLAEQEKIGHFFQKLDRLIDINKQKLGKLKASKSAYLTEMFPGEGEDRPRRRFQGFTGEWEEKKLGSILRTDNFRCYIKKPQLSGEHIVIQQGKDPIVGYADGEPYLDYEKVIIFGDHTLSLYKPRVPFFISTDGVKIIHGLSNIDSEFLLYVLERHKPRNEGYKRYYSILKDIEVYIPKKIEEQEKIGDFFQKLDQQIGLQEEKLEKLERMKKAYLAEMFV